MAGGVIACHFVIMIHLDRVEWAKFRTETTVHADVNVDEKGGGLGNGTPGVRVAPPHNPDALRRADLRANAAARTPIFTRTFRVVKVFYYEERHEPKPFGH